MPSKKTAHTLYYLTFQLNMTYIETGHIYLLDGRTPVTALKPLNRSKTIFSIELPNKSIDTVEIERLQPQHMDELSDETIDDPIEPAMHSMPDISND
jgi:hypothetical protein